MDLVNQWVSQEFANLAQVLADYDPNLRLEMVPFEQWGNLLDKSKVFRVVDTARNQTVLHADSLANPADILARVFSADQRHNKVVTNMDAKNAALRALEMRKSLDEEEAAKDFGNFILRNNKSRWHHEGRVRDDEFRDLGPVKKIVS